jgi:MFS family permease
MEHDHGLQKFWVPTLLAAAMLMVTMGARQSMGLFVSPLNTSTGLGIATISFAMAIGQFVWGAVQPIAGAVADRYGAGRVLVAGLLVLALGNAVTPFMSSTWGLIFTLGILTAVGSGAGSFSVLIGSVAQRVPTRRGMASGIISTGRSFRQFVSLAAAKADQRIRLDGRLWSLALITLRRFRVAPSGGNRTAAICQFRQSSETGAAAPPQDIGLKAATRNALADRSYLLLHAGFFTCGFHIAFLVTHLPGEVQLCGLPAQVASWSLAIIGLANIVGSLLAGWGVQHYRSKYILFWIASRSLLLRSICLRRRPHLPSTFSPGA